METSPNALSLPYAPTETADLYPESDGKPMAETDLHIDEIFRMRQILRAYFAEVLDVYVSGNLMMYYEEGTPSKAVSPEAVPNPKRSTYPIETDYFNWNQANRTAAHRELSRHDQTRIGARKGFSSTLLYSGLSRTHDRPG